MKTITAKQLGILMFIFSITFKVSRLPSLISSEIGRSATFFVLVMFVVDVLVGVLIYHIITHEGIKLIEERLNPIIYKVIMLAFSIYCVAKLLLVYCGTVIFIVEQLFDSISTFIVIITFVIPVAYFARTGIRSIARCGELIIIYVLVIFILNFVFLNTDLNFWNNLPVFTDRFNVLLVKSSKYLLWFGDYTPFLFVTLKASKNMKKIPVFSVIIIFISLLVSYIYLFAIYGDTTSYVSNFIVKLSSFNTFSKDLGRLDWLGIIAWLSMSTLYVSSYLWVGKVSLGKVIKNENWALVIILILVVLPHILVKDINIFIDLVQKPFVSFLAPIGNIIIPIIFFALTLVYCKRRKKEGYAQTLF